VEDEREIEFLKGAERQAFSFWLRNDKNLSERIKRSIVDVVERKGAWYDSKDGKMISLMNRQSGY
jgi:hypothetical protein